MGATVRSGVLVATTAHNAHVQQIARSFHEADALYAYATGGVDSFRNPVMRLTRRALAAALPVSARALAGRAVPDLPSDVVRAHWGWEIPRVLASRLPGGERLEDWLWHRAEESLDRRAAVLMPRSEVRAFLGVEYGALAALRAARRFGKPSVVTFLSPHHKTRARWVDAELDRYPEIQSSRRRALDRLAPGRDARRDEEAAIADWVEAGSSFTARSLVEAGIAPGKVLTVPLGGPAPVDPARLRSTPSPILRVVYVGPVSVRKGAHYLLRAWRRVAARGAELHFYGKPLLAPAVLRDAKISDDGRSAVFHGSVPQSELPAVYLGADVLILPTLCDGFGLVISEALAHGLPVITTTNAGAADLVENGRNGFVIPPADEDAIAGALQWCIDHKRDLSSMRESALAAAAKWTWADFRRRHWEVCRGALGLDGRVTELAVEGVTIGA